MKERKAFRKWDILVFAVSALVIFCLFTFFVIIPNVTKSDGFKIVIDNTEVFVFNYSDKTFSKTDGFDISVSNDGDLYTVTVKTEKGFNQISADTKQKTVWVSDADCSVGKDCVHSPKLTGDSGAIICVPHGLRVLPLKGGFTPPIGG
jgi:hypothetical protein